MQLVLLYQDHHGHKNNNRNLNNQKNRIVVGAYLIEAEDRDYGEIHLVKFRERIRADGPTVLYGEPAVQGKAA